MNEVAKENIKKKLEEAMVAEKMTPGEVAKLLRLPPSYISAMRNKSTWERCSQPGWSTVLSWVNSGLPMKEYAKKHTEAIESARPKKKKEKGIIEGIEIPTKMDDSEFIKLLEIEKLLLEKKLHAIHILLKHYLTNAE